MARGFEAFCMAPGGCRQSYYLRLKTDTARLFVSGSADRALC